MTLLSMIVRCARLLRPCPAPVVASTRLLRKIERFDLRADVDAMRLAAEAVALEQRVLHEQDAAARSAQDALLVVVEMHVAHGELVALDPDAGAVVVGYRDARALDAFDDDAVRLDHQSRLALDGVPAQVGAGLAAQNQTGRYDQAPSS